jgi:glycosyltransferase involved in cell wall biosynthesis
MTHAKGSSGTTININTPRLCLWWRYPCKSMFGVARAIASLSSKGIGAVCETNNDTARTKLGWNYNDFEDLSLEFLPEARWRDAITHIVERESGSLHIFNSYYVYEKMNYAVDAVLQRNIPYVLMSEAPCNFEGGLRKVAKSAYLQWFLPYLRSRARRDAKKLYCLSGNGEYARRRLKQLGCADAQIVPFGYFPEPRPLPPRRRDLKSKEAWLLCTGLLAEFKGQDLLIRALEKVSKHNNNWHLWITGYGPSERSLRQLQVKCGLQGRITFTGVLPDDQLSQLMSDSDLFIAPGYREPWGMRVPEALLAGLPVITSDGLGAAELVRSGKAGHVFPAGDANALAAILESLTSNSELISDLQRRTRSYGNRILPIEAAKYFLASLSALEEQWDELPPWLEGTAETVTA